MILNKIGDDGRTQSRLNRKCYLTSQREREKTHKIDGQCQLREMAKTLCGRVYILYSNKNRQIYLFIQNVFI